MECLKVLLAVASSCTNFTVLSFVIVSNTKEFVPYLDVMMLLVSTDKIEKIQRRATKMIPEIRNHSYH